MQLKFAPLLALCAATLQTAAVAQSVAPQPIHAACYRGPWAEVIWDRPETRFMESLVRHGYSGAQAREIAERVCLDPYIVGSPERIRARTRQILRETPPAGVTRAGTSYRLLNGN